MFGLQKTRKTIPVAEVPTGKRISIWGKTLTPVVNFSSYSPLTPLQKVSDRAEHLGSGLIHRGLKPNSNTFVGIFAQNRPEVSEV